MSPLQAPLEDSFPQHCPSPTPRLGTLYYYMCTLHCFFSQQPGLLLHSVVRVATHKKCDLHSCFTLTTFSLPVASAAHAFLAFSVLLIEKLNLCTFYVYYYYMFVHAAEEKIEHCHQNCPRVCFFFF